MAKLKLKKVAPKPSAIETAKGTTLGNDAVTPEGAQAAPQTTSDADLIGLLQKATKKPGGAVSRTNYGA